MDKYEMMDLTKRLAIETLRLIERFPQNRPNHKVSDQIARSSVSVGANYRAACRAKSKADFINKLKIVEEETDETMFHYEVLLEINTVLKAEMQTMHKEYESVLKIIVKSLTTLRGNTKS